MTYRHNFQKKKHSVISLVTERSATNFQLVTNKSQKVMLICEPILLRSSWLLCESHGSAFLSSYCSLWIYKIKITLLK